MVSKILLGYEEALWPKKLEISHASQILKKRASNIEKRASDFVSLLVI